MIIVIRVALSFNVEGRWLDILNLKVREFEWVIQV